MAEATHHPTFCGKPNVCTKVHIDVKQQSKHNNIRQYTILYHTVPQHISSTAGPPHHDLTYTSATPEHNALSRLQLGQKLLLLSIHGQTMLELLVLNAELACHKLNIMFVIESGQHDVPSFAEVVDHLQTCFFALHNRIWSDRLRN